MIQDPSSCFSVEPGLSNLPYQNINGEFLSSRTKSLYEFIDTSKMPVEVADGISEDSKSRDSVPAEGEDGDGVALPATRGGSYIYDTGTENNKYNEYNKFYNENYYLKKIKQEETDNDEEEENIGKRSWCNGTKVYNEDNNDEDLEQLRKRSWCIGTKVYTEGNTDGHLEKTRKRSCCYGKKVYKEVDDDERQNRERRYNKGNKDYTYNYKGTKDRNESFRIKFNFKRPEKVYYCSHCSFECKTMRELEQHKSVHRKVYKCSHCSFECKTKGAFEKHKSVHPNEKGYKCRYCSFECSQKPPVELHELKHDEYTPLAETKRKRQYETQYRRRKIAKFTCSRCNYSTDLKHRFQIHNISHYSTNVLRKKVMKQMNYISSKIS